MASGFLYRAGPWELDTAKTTASTAIAVLDAVKTTSGAFVVATAAAKVDGVALQSKLVGDSATTAIQYLRALPNRTKFLAQAKNSSNLVATDLHAQVDLFGTTGAQGFDRAVTTNGDVFLFKVISTGTSGQAITMFTDPSSESST